MRAAIVLMLCVSLVGFGGVAHADDALKLHAMPIARRNPRQRAASIGLLIGGGVCLALGTVFAGLAYDANKNATANMTYHPNQEDRRTDYQVADGLLFGFGSGAVISGIVLAW
ncbi:MAG TPA: hypothetical protein VIA18_30710 [Polyangia bacterium]|nr:hypothetical protein [Polyangia bacterium]